MKRIVKIYLPLVLLVAAAGCKKEYLDVRPGDNVPEETILGTTQAMTSALDGAYKSLYAYGTNGSTGHDNFGQKAVDLASDLMGNDMVVHLQGYNWFNRDYQYTEWQLPDATNRRPDIAWYFYYDLIKQVNTILKYIDAAKGSQTEKESIKGQALALRANSYYYLINLFQHTYKGNETKPGVPVYTEPPLDGGPRGTVQQVYDRIIADLTEAETLLATKSITNKNNINVNVVRGIRARVALVMEDWATAATYANKAREGYPLMSAAEYQSTGFSVISTPEWMWGSRITADQATIYASFFSHIDVSTEGYAYFGTQKKITKALYDQIPGGDVRKSVFMEPGTGTAEYPDYNQMKHIVPNPGSWAADYLYMRSSEMYLIEAEALARSGQDAPARTILETLVKARNPAYSASGFSGTALVNEILLQRRIELWGEGFSLIDIKRLKTGLNRPTGPGNHGAPNFDPAVYTIADGDPRFIMKLPKRELDNNPAMTPADQNP